MTSPAHAAGGFQGSWESIDTVDGSYQTLDIHGRGPHLSVHYVDYAASVCGGARATVSGSGEQDQDVLFANATVTCNPGGNFIRHRIQLAWKYDAGTDTLSDPDGVTWHRT
jgi:hypothetical protein